MPEPEDTQLDQEIAGKLLSAADRAYKIAPWKFMQDSELFGIRDEATKEWFIGCVLGNLGTLFAVVFYRNDQGRSWVLELVSGSGESRPEDALEALDYLKVVWCVRKDLGAEDLRTLQMAGYNPRGKGRVWPRFESASPGCYPWAVRSGEAEVLARLLEQAVRFFLLRKKTGVLHQGGRDGMLPMIPAGEGSGLSAEQIEWVPYVPPPDPVIAPVRISGSAQERLGSLPKKKGFVAELMVRLAPDMAFMKQAGSRPCLPRLSMVVDRSSGYVFCARLADGARPFQEGVGAALVEALESAKSRPEQIAVEKGQLAAALRPLCEAIGVSVLEEPVRAAHAAWAAFKEYASQQKRG